MPNVHSNNGNAINTSTETLNMRNDDLFCVSSKNSLFLLLCLYRSHPYSVCEVIELDKVNDD